MQMKKRFCGILATALAFSLAGADIASAQCRGGGQGQGGGRGACVQADQSQATLSELSTGPGPEAAKADSSVCVMAAVLTNPVRLASASPDTGPL